MAIAIRDATGNVVCHSEFDGSCDIAAGTPFRVIVDAFKVPSGGYVLAQSAIKFGFHDVTASDDHVIALVNAHATRGDRTLDYNTAEIFHVRDGKLTERWAFSDDTARITEFFS